MTQIFIFTASNSSAQRNLVESIENPVKRKTVLAAFGREHREELKRIESRAGGFYAWGAVPGERNIPTWREMDPGDYVLCVYAGSYHYAARVLGRYENVDFAETVWGRKEDGTTWQYMYFLTEPEPVEATVADLGDYLNRAYRGFVRIHDDRVHAIERDFGSLAAFFESELGVKQPSAPDAPTPEEIAGESLDTDDVVHGFGEGVKSLPIEGQKRVRQQVTYERNPANRKRAIEIHGTRCAVCDFDFDEVYGRALARSYIQIHHKKPVSEHFGQVDPETDLVPVCPNCHAMIHRKDPPLTVEELKMKLSGTNPGGAGRIQNLIERGVGRLRKDR